MRRIVLLSALLALFTMSAVAGAAGPPSATTGSASAVMSTSATVSGTVNPNAQATTYSFQYGPTTVYGQTTATQSGGGGSAAVNASAALTGLKPDTVYHFRITATNASGTTTGADGTLTTAPSPPTVATLAPRSASTHGATLAGTVNPNGAATTYVFEIGMSTAYGLQTKPVSLASGTSAQAIAATVDGLQANRRFHYRLVATNLGGTTTGTDQTFTTSPGSRTAPVSVSAKTVPTVATAFPYRFFTSGSITPPQRVNRARACKGFVAVRFKSGSRTISLRRAAVGGNCRFSSHVTFHIPRRVRRGHLRVTVLFSGNGVLGTKAGPAQTVAVG